MSPSPKSKRNKVLVDRGKEASSFSIHFATDTLFSSTPDLFKSPIGILQGIIDRVYPFPDMLEDLILTIHLFHDLLMSSFDILMVQTLSGMEILQYLRQLFESSSKGK